MREDKPRDRGGLVKIVFVTCPPGKGAELLRVLCEERLVAGGNLIPGIRSMYWWKGDLRDEAEEMLWMETEDDRVEPMMARLCEIHPYEVPKILTFEPRDAPLEYLRWVRNETRP
jgi:periplasmic divalent cation tolerance protein